MAEKLSIIIAMEGGAEIERQLAGIGEAGTKAFGEISKAAEQVGGFQNLKPEEVTNKLKDMGVTGVAEFQKIQQAVQQAGRLERIVQGVAQIEDGFAKIGDAAVKMSATVEKGITRAANSLSRALGPIGGLARALGPVGIAAGLMGASFIKGTFDAVNAINELVATSMKLGVAVNELNQFRTAMEQAGVSSKALSSGLSKVQSDVEKIKLAQVTKNFNELKKAAEEGFTGAGSRALRELREAAEQFTPAGKAAREALDKLGFPIAGTAAQDVRELGTELAKLKGLGIDIQISDNAVTRINKIIDAVARMPDTAQRTAIALQFLGDVLGTELIRGLQTGTLELDKFKAKVGEGIISEKERENAAKFAISLNQLTNEWQKFNSVVAAPAGIKLFDFATRELQQFKKDLLDLGEFLTKLFTDPFKAKGFIKFDFANSPMGKMLQGLGQGQVQIAKFFASFATGAATVKAVGVAIDGAISAIGRFIVSLRGVTWNIFRDAAVQSWEQIKAGAASAGAAIMQFAASLAGIVWDAISGAGVAAWNTLKTAVVSAGASIQQFAAGLGGVVWDAISSAGVAAWNTIKTAITDAGSAIQQFASQLPGIVWDTIASAGVAAWQAIVGAVQEAGSTIQQFAASLGGIVWDAISGAGVAAWNAITQAIRDAINAIGEFLGLTGGAAGGAIGGAKSGGQIGGFQSGGLLGGRGTGTSDSNLVRVSRGEYIVPARAVRQPGVLSFLEALRRSGGNLERVLDDLGRFALGGLAPRAIPAFATGGLAGGGMSNVTIQFPGMPEISGLRAPAKVVEELRKTAAMAQVRSGGRKPSRYS